MVFPAGFFIAQKNPQGVCAAGISKTEGCPPVYLRDIMKFCIAPSATDAHWFWSWRKRFHGS